MTWDPPLRQNCVARDVTVGDASFGFRLICDSRIGPNEARYRVCSEHDLFPVGIANPHHVLHEYSTHSLGPRRHVDTYLWDDLEQIIRRYSAPLTVDELHGIFHRRPRTSWPADTPQAESSPPT